MNMLKKVMVVFLLSACAPLSFAGQGVKDVGSTLHKKVAVELADVPEGVKSVILKSNPEFKMQEAQKELKHGNTYYDIEGLDAQGNEIEFDMLLESDGSWRIAEIQRDLTIEQCPASVVALYNERVGNVSPARIIESDQGDGTVVYEFYTSEKGQERKYEIKLHVEFLEKEWQH